MKEHHIGSDHIEYVFSPNTPPILMVEPGDVIVLSLKDCFDGQFDNLNARLSDLDATRLNPLTGPVAINSAEPGDAIAVSVLDIKPTGTGIILAQTGLATMNPHLAESTVHRVRITDGHVELLPGIEIPQRPMIGTVGCTPNEVPVSAVLAGSHGGNMDHALVAPGATVYLPISVPKGMLLVGDVHALMGDGEVCTGVEVSAEVRLRIELVKSASIRQPWIATSELWVSTGYGYDFIEALRAAFREMWQFVCSACHVTTEEGFILVGTCGNLGVSRGGSLFWKKPNGLTPQVTARVELPLEYLEQVCRDTKKESLIRFAGSVPEN
jgi:amidase